MSILSALIVWEDQVLQKNFWLGNTLYIWGKKYFLIVWALKYLPEGVMIVNQYFNWKMSSL